MHKHIQPREQMHFYTNASIVWIFIFIYIFILWKKSLQFVEGKTVTVDVNCPKLINLMVATFVCVYVCALDMRCFLSFLFLEFCLNWNITKFLHDYFLFLDTWHVMTTIFHFSFSALHAIPLHLLLSNCTCCSEKWTSCKIYICFIQLPNFPPCDWP